MQTILKDPDLVTFSARFPPCCCS